MTLGLSLLATVTASTKRSPAISGGLRGAMATNLASVSITPLWPVSAELRNRLHLDTPYELWQSYAPGAQDIQEGDVLVVSGTEYQIRAVENWPATTLGGDAYVQMVLEELKT